MMSVSPHKVALLISPTSPGAGILAGTSSRILFSTHTSSRQEGQGGRAGRRERRRPLLVHSLHCFLSWALALGLCGLPLSQGCFLWPGDGWPKGPGDGLRQTEEEGSGLGGRGQEQWKG